MTTKAADPQANQDGLTKVHHSPMYFAFQRFLRNRAAVVAAIVLLVIILMAVFAPLIARSHYAAQDFLRDSLAFPSADHWFGVDNLGRDLFSRIIYGARVSVGLGFAAVLLATLIGIPLGAAAGFFGGKVDWFIMRIIEIFSVVPPLLAALLLGALIGGGVYSILFVATLFGLVQICLLVRAQFKAYKEREFVTAARALGASSGYIVRKHLLPNAISPIIVGFVLAVPQAMMLEAALSFLGVGIAPPVPSWGTDDQCRHGLHVLLLAYDRVPDTGACHYHPGGDLRG